MAEDQKYLLSDEGVSWQDYLNELKDYILSEEYNDQAKASLPRFDYASIYARGLPFIAYDDLNVKGEVESIGISGTAFTDGVNCVFYTGFLKKIKEADEKEGKQGAVFLALHEVWHNMLMHHFRLKEFPHAIANRAEDMYINTNLQDRYKESKPCSVLHCGIGFEEGDIEKFSNWSENDIATYMMKNNPPPTPGGQPKSGKGNGSGQSVPGSGNGQPGEPADGEPGESSPEDGDDFGDSHIIDPQTLAEILHKVGLGHVVEALKIPEDAEKAKIRADEAQSNLVSAIKETNAAYRDAGSALPGGHIGSYMMEIIQNLKKPKVAWKVTLNKLLIGSGMGRGYTDDYPNDAFFFDPSMMGLSRRPYMGTMVPAKSKGCIVIGIDSSGSMSNEDLGESLGWVFDLIKKSKNNSAVPEVLVYWMDTTMRGEPIKMDEKNYQKVIKDFEQGKKGAMGRGGTNLENDIIQVLQSEDVKKAKQKFGQIKSFICMTDLGDSCPKRQNLPKDIPKSFWYFAVTGTYRDEFAKGVSSYAKVINMGGNNLSVDLDANNQKPEAKRMKP